MYLFRLSADWSPNTCTLVMTSSCYSALEIVCVITITITIFTNCWWPREIVNISDETLSWDLVLLIISGQFMYLRWKANFAWFAVIMFIVSWVYGLACCCAWYYCYMSGCQYLFHLWLAGYYCYMSGCQYHFHLWLAGYYCYMSGCQYIFHLLLAGDERWSWNCLWHQGEKHLLSHHQNTGTKSGNEAVW